MRLEIALALRDQPDLMVNWLVAPSGEIEQRLMPDGTKLAADPETLTLLTSLALISREEWERQWDAQPPP